ncbi:heavy metal-associated isoprenylated plant protein 5-like [Phragmites australis]|uniref:heavy metal-associated isoprenylated plant protein 5-like n=1 Tax=Phragmites australis TaxID=29695 RepID=UPI002D778C89|nr:heavy metal-associated isoprenylated plant protein 5-like [Phragmites australis]
MAPVILAMDVHCDSCAKKIRKAVMKMPGVESVSASFETGLVVVEGTADAAALSALLQSKLGKPVTVVTDGAEEGEAATAGGGSVAASPPSPYWPPRRAPEPAPGPPIVLEIDLHCRSCAKKVQKVVMDIPGVETVTTDVEARRVEVTGTADASMVATSVEVRMRTSVRVVSDPWRPDFPGYDHERRKAAAARATAQRMEELYAERGVEEEDEEEEAAATEASEPAQAPPVQQVGGYPPPANGAAPPEGYYYPRQRGEAYGVQHWATPYPEPGSYYPGQGGEAYGQQWEAPSQHHMYNDDNTDAACSVQ